MASSWSHICYRPALVVVLLPSLLLIGIFSYYPALRSLIGGFYRWNGFSAPVYAGCRSSPSTSSPREAVFEVGSGAHQFTGPALTVSFS